jgi:hypothetical protein
MKVYGFSRCFLLLHRLMYCQWQVMQPEASGRFSSVPFLGTRHRLLFSNPQHRLTLMWSATGIRTPSLLQFSFDLELDIRHFRPTTLLISKWYKIVSFRIDRVKPAYATVSTSHHNNTTSKFTNHTLRPSCSFSYTLHPLTINLRGEVMWEPSKGTSHMLHNRYQGKRPCELLPK